MLFRSRHSKAETESRQGIRSPRVDWHWSGWIMNERWIEIRKGADFAKIGETFSIDPVIARLIRNRDVTEMDEIRSYLYGGTEGLHDPRKMRDMEKAVSIITDKIKQGKQIRIIGDYDIDGVSATYILLKGLRRVGACASVKIPDRKSTRLNSSHNVASRMPSSA